MKNKYFGPLHRSIIIFFSFLFLCLFFLIFLIIIGILVIRNSNDIKEIVLYIVLLVITVVSLAVRFVSFFSSDEKIRSWFYIQFNDNNLSIIWPDFFKKDPVVIYYSDIKSCGIYISKYVGVTGWNMQRIYSSVYCGMMYFTKDESISDDQKLKFFYNVPDDNFIWCAVTLRKYRKIINILPKDLSEKMLDYQSEIELIGKHK